jgi:hypothetical protein
MSENDPFTEMTEVVSDVVRLEEKINAITEKLHENTVLTQENLAQLHEVKTVLKVMETKIIHLEETDQEQGQNREKDRDNKREWAREIGVALVGFALGLAAKWFFGIG